MCKDGVPLPKRFQFASNTAKQLSQCARDSIKRLGAARPNGARATCELLGLPTLKPQEGTQSSGYAACQGEAALDANAAADANPWRRPNTFEANPWRWPRDLQHNRVKVFAWWSVYGCGVQRNAMSSATLKNVLQRGYFSVPAEFKSLLQEVSLLPPPQAHCMPSGGTPLEEAYSEESSEEDQAKRAPSYNRRTASSESKREDTSEDDASAAKAPRMEETVGMSSAGGGAGEQQPASPARRAAWDSPERMRPEDELAVLASCPVWGSDEERLAESLMDEAEAWKEDMSREEHVDYLVDAVDFDLVPFSP